MKYGLKLKYRPNGRGPWLETILPNVLDGAILGDDKAKLYAGRVADSLRQHGAVVEVVTV